MSELIEEFRKLLQWHVGRSWSGHLLEDACPCPQEACGLVELDKADPACVEHPPGRSKTMRQGHPADQCEGETT